MIIKTYTITVTEKENGIANIIRVNDGFNLMELLEIVQHAQSSLLDQIKGEEFINKDEEE